ncbi:MAG: ABC transporter ATP-binding protein [Paracoccaceae bacterium]
MATITLDGLRHSYVPRARRTGAPGDWALQSLDLEWQDGGAYALLGPSGCGKTTLLNLISGLLRPTEGRIRFDGDDVTRRGPDRRNIAQVFQFPVIYDTMTVAENLAFPLRNRRVPAAKIAARVAEIAEMLELAPMLDTRAAGLSADEKQKISLGRGLVREDVAAILFDEPLTVIDPHLKWQLRSKLKELHQKVGATMIYVTHDQTEALTFADRVVVMSAGEVVQTGTPIELFERPMHTFVGHFIGSPGMNLLPASIATGRTLIAPADGAEAVPVETANARPGAGNARLEIGVRPEFVRLDPEGHPAALVKIADAGRFRVVTLRLAGHPIALLAPEHAEIPAEPRVRLDPARTYLYADGRLAGEEA